ncbi:ABC transporter substrate-binding protein [Halorubrum sp. AD140]|uniref:ABC transporter substrate-binding protein n=1 Tax=Halorubrum sp. AD140 TaxID=3050073 RepID=UPI002ACCEA56|nr:ABC transporter substrate-binding protein [Halorubrum sp. AD140]MDZ5812757.1 ABC transporter substrate-binding protein [Halorubrum sp. AD140]
MPRQDPFRDTQTRRDYVKYGGTVVGGGLLAGCTGRAADEGGSADDESAEDDESTGDDSYTVSMEPAGTVTFEDVPERYVTYKEAWAEMAIALGRADDLVGTDLAYGGQSELNDLFYSELDGVEFPTDDVTDLRGGGEEIDKEVFYEIDADVHLIDPNLPSVYFDWDNEDTDEVAENVAPFFGSFIRRERDDSWGEEYEFYGLYESFERVSRLFREEERYEAFAEVHDEMLAEIESRLPPEDERPSIGLVNGGSDPSEGTFYVMDPTAAGYEMKHYRDLGIRDAFADAETGENGETDYETLVEYDPDQLFVHWGVTYSDEEFAEAYVEPMENDSVGSELTAVREGRVFKGGTAEQGPITNLFQTELVARDQYPDEFGDEELFDRQRVAEIVAGDL